MTKKYAGLTRKELADTFTPEADEGPESKLQAKIVAWAREWGHPCLSFRQSRQAKGFITPGWPDITLLLKGEILFIELKSKSGRLSQEQKDMAIMFQHLGFDINEVRSYKRFLEIVQGGK